MKSRFIFCATLFAVGLAEAVCLNPFGCGPSNLEECRSEAAKMPTERGVTVALTDCQAKFVTKPAEEQRKLDERKFASGWTTLITSSSPVTLQQAKKVLGSPADEGVKHQCQDDKGNATVGQCTWYEWLSKKEKPICRATFLTLETPGEIVYRAEFGSVDNLLKRWYIDPISTCERTIQQEK